MAENQLRPIRKYCNTDGYHLSSGEKNLLCKVLENPKRYDGFTSKVYEEHNSGKDYRGRWESTSRTQYRINIDSNLSIDERWYHGADGYIQDEHWSWNNPWHITDVRRILEILHKIEFEL